LKLIIPIFTELLALGYIVLTATIDARIKEPTTAIFARVLAVLCWLKLEPCDWGSKVALSSISLMIQGMAQ